VLFATHPSSGPTPSASALLASERLIVSEAFNNVTNASAVSSYQLQNNDIQTISTRSPRPRRPRAGIALSRNERFAYATNTGSDSISGFAVDPNGQALLLVASGCDGHRAAASETRRRFRSALLTRSATDNRTERARSGRQRTRRSNRCRVRRVRRNARCATARSSTRTSRSWGPKC